MTEPKNTDHYQGALLEEIRDEVKAIHESVAPMPTLSRDVAQLKDDMVDVKADVKTIKLAVKGQSKDHKDLVKRVSDTGTSGLSRLGVLFLAFAFVGVEFFFAKS